MRHANRITRSIEETNSDRLATRTGAVDRLETQQPQLRHLRGSEQTRYFLRYCTSTNVVRRLHLTSILWSIVSVCIQLEVRTCNNQSEGYQLNVNLVN